MRKEFGKFTKRLAFARADGFCEKCKAPLQKYKYEFDHRISAQTGDNSLGNCWVLCLPCHDEKTYKEDIPREAKIKRVQDRERGIRNRRTIGYRRFDGSVVKPQ